MEVARCVFAAGTLNGRCVPGVLQTIAELPESWDGFGAYALIAGPRGELGLVAYRGSGASASKIGVFHADEEGTFELVKITSPATDLIGPPMIAPLGIVYTTDSAKGARLPFGEMDPAGRRRAADLLPALRVSHETLRTLAPPSAGSNRPRLQ
jgi:hypothetical protein